MSKTALLVVDTQNDFCPGGALPAPTGLEAAERIAQLPKDKYSLLVATEDWHIDPGNHYVIWPVHCKAGTHGAELAPPLQDIEFDRIFRKGQYGNGYSGFVHPELASYLRDNDVDTLDVVGIATEFCVRATVLNALAEGFKVRLLRDCIAPIDHEDGERALAEMEEAGAELA